MNTACRSLGVVAGAVLLFAAGASFAQDAPAAAADANAAATGESAGGTAQKQGDEPKSLSASEEESVEAEILAKEPNLAPVGDPHRVEQLWQLARDLTMRRAYCRATEHLDAIESEQGAISDNRSFAAQAYYLCARARLEQGQIADAKAKLERSMAIVGERPEHRDLLFKLAIVRARTGIEQGDIEAIRGGLAEARKLGVAMGPGGGKRLADWALPIMHDTANLVAGWSSDLLQKGDRDLADAASALALEYNPNDRIAITVRQKLVMSGVALPVIGAGLALLVIGGLLWRVLRARRMRRVVGGAEDFDEA